MLEAIGACISAVISLAIIYDYMMVWYGRFNEPVKNYAIHDPQGVIGQHEGYYDYEKAETQANRIASERAKWPIGKRCWAFPIKIVESKTVCVIDKSNEKRFV